MKFLHRRISFRERVAIEKEAVERYQRHVDVPRMVAELRELRNENAALRSALWGQWEHLDYEVRNLVGEPPARRPTPIVVLPDGQFASVGGGS